MKSLGAQQHGIAEWSVLETSLISAALLQLQTQRLLLFPNFGGNSCFKTIVSQEEKAYYLSIYYYY